MTRAAQILSHPSSQEIYLDWPPFPGSVSSPAIEEAADGPAAGAQHVKRWRWLAPAGPGTYRRSGLSAGSCCQAAPSATLVRVCDRGKAAPLISSHRIIGTSAK